MKSTTQVVILATLLFVCTATITVAQEPAYDGYFSGHIGLGMMTNADLFNPGLEFDLGYSEGIATSAALGLASPMYRSEFEVSYQQSDVNYFGNQGSDIHLGGDTSALTGLLNAYYDFTTGNVLRPYLTGGLGLSQVELSVDSNNLISMESDNDTAFAFQLGAGLGYAITDTLILDLRYRYLSVQKLELDANRFELESHNILAGIRIKF